MYDARRPIWVPLLLTAAILLASAEPVGAHAFGQRYDLPVPLGLYLLGAAAAVVFSFVVIAVFVRATARRHTYPRADLRRYRAGRLLTHEWVIFAVKLVFVALFVLIVVAGFIGEQHPLQNVAPTLVWIIGWVGLAYVSAFVGNLWVLINPWRALFAWAERLYRGIRPGRELALHLPHAERLGVWPGIALLLTFSWIELVFPEPARPANIAWMVVGYSLITWTGMFLSGRERWLRQGEVFSLVFGLLARFGPTEVSVARTDVCARCGLNCLDRDGRCVDCYRCIQLTDERDREWSVRPYTAGLLRDEPMSTSMVGFVLLVLSVVLFDGFLATPAWWNLVETVRPYVLDLGDAFLMTAKTVALVMFWLLFLSAYLTTCWLMAAVSGVQLTGWEIARKFALTLVPIAIAYHLAHYLTYLLIQGQYIIRLASDPFGYGWDLLGTAAHRIDIAIVGARFAWYTAVITIVLGHIIAVYLAHHRATRVFADRRFALRSQYPLTALMVAYTITSLSILAEPIVESRPPAPIAAEEPELTRVRIPEDAVLPLVSSGRLIEVGADKYGKAKLTYKSMVSAFHDGTRSTVADILYPYIFAYRWGVPGPDQPPSYDPYVAESTALIRERLVGLRVAGIDKTSRSTRVGDFTIERELQIIEVYLSAAPDDPQEAAAVAPPWNSLPWHVLVLMEEVVKRGWAAFSQTEAQRRDVPWLDLVRLDSLSRRLAPLVAEFERDAYRPATLKDLVSIDQARTRWSALKKFHQERGHFLVTNGPYVLKGWSKRATTFEVFRNLSYPLGVGSYDAYPIPRRAYIANIERKNNALIIFAEIEKVEKFQRTYEIVRAPLTVAKSGPTRVDVAVCRYLVVSSEGQVVHSGQGRLEENGTFAVDLEGKLGPGDYTVVTALSLNGNTMNPDIKRILYTVTGDS